MSFNPLETFKRHRIARAGLALLVLTGAAFAEYKLANVERPVDLKTTGKFSPATIRLGQEELIIEGPKVESEERTLFSHDGKPNETVDVTFDSAQLSEETIGDVESPGSSPPSTPNKITYWPEELESKSSAGNEPCRTRVELSAAASKPPDEIHIFQLDHPGENHYRHLEMITKGAGLSSLLSNESSDPSKVGPGCKYHLKVGGWQKSLTKVDVTTVMAENSGLRLYFRSQTTDSSPWGAEGVLPFDLGTEQMTSTDKPHIRAHSVSIKSLDPGNPQTFLSAESTKPDELTIRDLKIGSDQIQVNIDGTGWVEIDEKPWTVNFVKRLEDNKILGALLAAANFALLGWLSRMVFKTPSKPAPTQTP